MKTVLNDYQRAVLQDYADGEFAYLIEEGEVPDVHELGDTLLAFILIELSDENSVEDLDDGIGRLTRGRDDLEVALEALNTLRAVMEDRIQGTRADVIIVDDLEDGSGPELDYVQDGLY